MFKKALSLLLALMLIVTSVSVTALSVAAAEGEEEQEASTFYVVGDNADLFGAAWGDGMIDDNAMTANEDGTYTKVYEGVGPIDKVISLKVTDGVNWIGTATGNNVAIELNDNTDLTVKYDPKAEGNQVTVTGEGVKMHEFNPAAVEVMRVVGSAQGSFLNNQSWKEAADENNMTKISDGVYEIVFEEMEALILISSSLLPTAPGPTTSVPKRMLLSARSALLSMTAATSTSMFPRMIPPLPLRWICPSSTSRRVSLMLPTRLR